MSAASGGSPPAFGLEWILGPLPVEEFLRTHWELEPLLIKRGDPSYFQDLPGLEKVDELISAASGRMGAMGDGLLVKSDGNGGISEKKLRVGADGMMDIEEIYSSYHQGYSLVVNQIHRKSPAVARLCLALETELHHRAGANLYLTPRHGQGFLPHADTHDVVILQLHGEKQWHIGEPSVDLPLAASKQRRPPSMRDHRTFHLETGDALYLPRGFPHEAVTSGRSSLHLTVGIHAYRWVDLLHEALNALADEQVEFRRALAPGFLDLPLDSTRLAAVAEELARALTHTPLAERAKSRLGGQLLRTRKAALRSHFRSIDAIAAITEHSVVSRPRELLCRVHATGEEATIEFPANYVSGPVMIKPALEFVAAHERFVVGDLPGGLSADQKVDLVTRLISEGLLDYVGEKP
ncbi:cupin domain-containing protein [Sphaerisporangium perillae]|uniref:cupin domain-containing protein n=1 Tax=Sphaerisporangium perillae TaxID=2935860 RepID=UPI00200E3F5F|nr:cupin domain-containing protein [Sphaerisporangium perillae]